MKHTPLRDVTVNDVLVFKHTEGLNLLGSAGNAFLDDHKVDAGGQIHVGNDANLHTADGAADTVDNSRLTGLFKADHLIGKLELDCEGFADVHDTTGKGNKLVAHCCARREYGVEDVGLGKVSGAQYKLACAVGENLETVLVDVGNEDFVGLALQNLGRGLDLELSGVVALVDNAVEGLVILNGHFLNGIADLGESAETGSAVDLSLVVVIQGKSVYTVYTNGGDARPFVIVAEKTLGHRADLESFYYFRGSL